MIVSGDFYNLKIITASSVFESTLAKNNMSQEWGGQVRDTEFR